jgi:hypothetical protein
MHKVNEAWSPPGHFFVARETLTQLEHSRRRRSLQCAGRQLLLFALIEVSQCEHNGMDDQGSSSSHSSCAPIT